MPRDWPSERVSSLDKEIMFFPMLMRGQILLQKLRGGTRGKVENVDLPSPRVEEVVKDHKGERDKVKMKDYYNSTKEAKKVRSKLIE